MKQHGDIKYYVQLIVGQRTVLFDHHSMLPKHDDSLSWLQITLYRDVGGVRDEGPTRVQTSMGRRVARHDRHIYDIFIPNKQILGDKNIKSRKS